VTSDPLSDALDLVDARCVISRGFTIGGDWSLRLLPRARLKLIAVVHGSCWLTVDRVEQPVQLRQGDVAVLNDRDLDILASDPSLEPDDATSLFAHNSDALIRIGDHYDVTVIGGHVELNRGGEDLLLATLAPLTHIRANAAEAPVLQWLLGRLLHEMSTDQPGAGFAAHQHAQLLFVEVLRAYLATAGPFPPGWLRALGDQRLAPATRLMHADPARAWHLDELATSAGMSRTTFAARYKSAAGIPPLTYLHHWRMRLAERALRETDISIARLAPQLGYASESAFSNAFKRTTGLAPHRYRTSART
jgi:AraC-like DNA-binding protein